MHEYLKWNEKTITDFSDDHINALYNEGYVFTRLGKGIIHQTRSVRIDLSKFELSSENRRILKKNPKLQVTSYKLPYSAYDWAIGKMGKDFYETKFGDGTFSANKIKELMTDTEKSNFNAVLLYTLSPYQGELEGVYRSTGVDDIKDPSQPPLLGEEKNVGYCITRETNELLHYSYPFYKLQVTSYKLQNIGMSMMIHAIIWAKENKKRYVFLGSAQRPTDTYKLQFTGLEWFNSKSWSSDTQELKEILHSAF